MSASGTNLPIRNVRFHGESWRVSGRATETAKATFMTHMRHWMARLVALRSAVLEIFSFETYSTAQNLAIDQTTSGFEHGKFREAAGCYPAKIEF